MPSQTREQRTIAQAAAQIAASGASVEVLALTGDEALLATLREAVGDHQRVWHAPTPDQAIELVMAGNVGVIVIDTLATGLESAQFCENVRSQFPDVILVVAGTVDDQTHLVKHITSGDIYRFLHKPVSTARARQFIDTAIRRHLEGRTFTPAEIAPARSGRSKRWTLIGLGSVVVVGIAVAGFLLRPDSPEEVYRPASSAQPASEEAPAAATPSPEPTDSAEPSTTAAPSPTQEAAVPEPSPPPTQTTTAPVQAQPSASTDVTAALLAQARDAFARGELIAPSSKSALDHYRAVLARDANNREAQEGLDQIADQLLTQAESALLEERVEDAARDIEAASNVRPNNVRLAFITAQLTKERERKYITMAREAAAKGNHDRARSLIERAQQGSRTPSPVLAEARKELEQLRRGTNVGNLLRLANERLKDNRLVEPANDNARSYIEAALAADPGNASALQARRALADQLLARGTQAIVARDPVAASSWLSQAEGMNADRAALRAAQRDLQALRQTTARGDQLTRLTTLLNERLSQDRVLEPAGDSASHYWQELRTLDASNGALAPALQSMGQKLIQQARQAATDGRLDDAQRALDEAKRLGFASTDLTAVERSVATTRERNAFMSDIVAANLLARDKQVAPKYPAAAEKRGIEGWVELDFTIATDGRVKDLVVRGAEPAGVFDEAAVTAVAQWIYRPVIRNGRPVEQRARLRLRFNVPD